MTDKEKLIKTFKEVGVDFEINSDDDILITEIDSGRINDSHLVFSFNDDDKLLSKYFYED